MSTTFKIHGFRSIADKKRQHSCARNSLKELIIKFFSDIVLSKKMVHITKDSLGKPHISLSKSHQKIEVSIAHTHNFTFVGCTNNSKYLGVDVEKIKIINEVLLNGFLTTQEKNILKKVPREEFLLLATKIWCLKESIMKALGCGMRLRPTRIDVSDLIFAEKGTVLNFHIDGNNYLASLVFFMQKEEHVFTGVEMNKIDFLRFISSKK